MIGLRAQRRRSQALVQQVNADREQAEAISEQAGEAIKNSVGSVAGLSWSFSAGALAGESLESDARTSHHLLSGLVRKGVVSLLVGNFIE